MSNLVILIAYYFLTFISILGYGLFFLGIFKKQKSTINLGYAGLFGIFVLLLYSYLSNFILAHSEIHNILLIILGLILSFLKLFKNF